MRIDEPSGHEHGKKSRQPARALSEKDAQPFSRRFLAGIMKHERREESEDQQRVRRAREPNQERGPQTLPRQHERERPATPLVLEHSAETQKREQRQLVILLVDLGADQKAGPQKKTQAPQPHGPGTEAEKLQAPGCREDGEQAKRREHRQAHEEVAKVALGLFRLEEPRQPFRHQLRQARGQPVRRKHQERLAHVIRDDLLSSGLDDLGTKRVRRCHFFAAVLPGVRNLQPAARVAATEIAGAEQADPKQGQQAD